jgi:hypothetical protein
LRLCMSPRNRRTLGAAELLVESARPSDPDAVTFSPDLAARLPRSRSCRERERSVDIPAPTGGAERRARHLGEKQDWR